MDLLTIVLFAAVFLFAASLVEFGYLSWTEGKLGERRKLKKRLLRISAGGRHGTDKLERYRDKTLRDLGAWNRLALSVPRLAGLDRLLLRAGIPLNASGFLLLTLGGAVLGLAGGWWLLPHTGSALLGGLVLGGLPYLWLKVRERKVLARFQEQFPEALNLLARALRSGHALSSGMEMIATEMEAPIGPEFAAVVDEINLGLTLKEALENLCERVPQNQELRFFAIALLVQKETGGNIAEILDNISRLIRERVKFRRQVTALTAEGRISAFVLLGLPVALFLYIYLVNYNYISLLWTERIGRLLLGGALVLQACGYFVIRRIINVEL